MTLNIAGSVAAQQLAQALVGSGVTISNVSFTGAPNQAGTFTDGLAAGGVDSGGYKGVGFDTGIVLSTGNVIDSASPQTGTITNTDLNESGDPVLDAQTRGKTYDAAVLEFDFNPGNATTIYFNFVFASGEYPSSPAYNDGLAVLVNNTNVALVPGDKTPVNVADFSKAINQGYYKEASSVALNEGNPTGFSTQDISAQIQSLSVPLQAAAKVLPNQTNHIKFVIADSGDGNVDSLVFVQANSLSTTPLAVSQFLAAPALTLAPASDSGARGDGITNVTTPVITGTGAAGDTITLFDAKTQIGTATVGADGTWSFTTGALAAGRHTLTATQTDKNSNVSPASSPLTLNIDFNAPDAPQALTLAASSDSGAKGDHLTNDNTPTIDGTAEAASTVRLYDGKTLIGSTTTDHNGLWSIDVANALKDGQHHLFATATDAAGNDSASSVPFDLSIDTAPPAAPKGLALAPRTDSGVVGDGITNVNKPTIVGTTDAASTVRVYDGKTLLGSTTADESGAWSFTVGSKLADGTHGITARTSDAAGNDSDGTAVFKLTIDTTAPLASSTSIQASADASPTPLRLTDPTDGGAPLTIIVSALPKNGTVTLANGDAVSVGQELSGAQLAGLLFAAATGMAGSSSAFAYTVTDAAGNSSGGSVALAVGLSPPVLTPASLITNDGAQSMGGWAPPGCTVTLFSNGQAIGTGTADAASGTFAVTLRARA